MEETFEDQVLRVMKEMILSGEMHCKIVDGEPLFSLGDSLSAESLPASLPHLRVILNDWED
jgi:hypothetical protein